MVYQSPCWPCDYNYFAVDDFGDYFFDVCNCPKDKLECECLLRRYCKEMDERLQNLY